MIRPYFFADKNDVDRPTRPGVLGIQKHVNAGYGTKREAIRLDRYADRTQLTSINGYIYILGQPRGHRIDGINVQEDRKAAYHSIRNARGFERRGKSLRHVQDSLHRTLEDSISEHRFSLAAIYFPK